MQLLKLFEITVREPGGADRTLLVVAATEREARELVRPRGLVLAVNANHGPFAVRGASRVIGAVEMRKVG